MNSLFASYENILSSFQHLEIESILSDEDKARGSRFLREADRSRFIAARLLLYAVLKKQQNPLSLPVDFVYDTYGKPSLEMCKYRFNWSHSGDLVALIIGHEVCGIDVELHQKAPLFDIRSLCTDSEWKWLTEEVKQPGDDETGKFYLLWTAKESVLKAMGTGLSCDPAQIQISFERNHEGFTGLTPGGFEYNGRCKRLVYGNKTYSISWCSRAGYVEPISEFQCY